MLQSTTAVLTWPLRHIRTKIIVPYAILTIIVAMVGAYLVTQVVTGSLQERFDNQLAEAGRVTSDAVIRKERDQLAVVRSMAFTQGVAQAVEQRDQAGLDLLLSPIAANGEVERAEVVDASGERVLGLAASDAADGTYASIDADEPSEWWIVQQVLAGGDALGDKYASLVETEDGFFLFTAAPIRTGDRTVGAMLVGTRLDSLVAEIKAAALADVTIYDYEGHPIASSFAVSEEPVDEADLALSPTLAADVAGTSDSTLRESRSLFSRDYDLAYGQLRIRDNAVGLFSVALPTNWIISAGTVTRLQMSAIFAAAMICVLLIGYVLAQRISAPISKLVRAAQQVTAGDLQTRSHVRSRDEIGELAAAFDHMTESLEEYTARLRRQHIGTVKALTSAIDARDPYTLGHSMRVGQLALSLGRQLQLPERTLEHLEFGGYLHDIGKIGIRDAVLLKPGALTEQERYIIEGHPETGVGILEAAELSPETMEFVLSHHERLDGSGYPHGRTHEQLSIVARIAAVADMYDAMTTDRPYRPAMSPDEALAILKSQAGRLLDPKVVAALGAILKEWEKRRREDPTLKGYKLPEAVGRVTTRLAA
jgi:putative nucleotidyltransferase with HDIG domain